MKWLLAGLLLAWSACTGMAANCDEAKKRAFDQIFGVNICAVRGVAIIRKWNCPSGLDRQITTLLDSGAGVDEIYKHVYAAWPMVMWMRTNEKRTWDERKAEYKYLQQNWSDYVKKFRRWKKQGLTRRIKEHMKAGINPFPKWYEEKLNDYNAMVIARHSVATLNLIEDLRIKELAHDPYDDVYRCEARLLLNIEALRDWNRLEVWKDAILKDTMDSIEGSLETALTKMEFDPIAQYVENLVERQRDLQERLWSKIIFYVGNKPDGSFLVKYDGDRQWRYTMQGKGLGGLLFSREGLVYE